MHLLSMLSLVRSLQGSEVLYTAVLVHNGKVPIKYSFANHR